MDKHGRSSYNRANISLLFLAFLANPLQLQLRVYTSRTDLTDDEIGKRSTNIRHIVIQRQENNNHDFLSPFLLQEYDEKDYERLFAIHLSSLVETAELFTRERYIYIGASQEDSISAADRSWFAYNFIKSSRSVNPKV